MTTANSDTAYGPRKAGLLGRTLGHSLSPQVHRLFGDYDYRLYEREPADVAAFVRSGELNFFNVTIPYKRTVYDLCDDLSPLARRMGNVNFVMRRADGSLYGDNTDAYGLERLLAQVKAQVRGRVCSILGAGGAAMTAKAVLEDAGASRVDLVRRGESPADDAYLIVNATPVGMFPDVRGVRIDIRDYPNCEVVADLVYNPSPTRLVREARACGLTAADGMVMLIAQAYRAAALAGVASGRTLYLYGPPASGKSTLGVKVAAAMGRELIDLDAAIVARAGRTIPEIFASEGETGFRARERTELAAIAERGAAQVVALGGGALLDPRAREIAERSGRIVCLDCPTDLLVRRLKRGSRPLADDPERLNALLAERQAHYASFPTHICLVRT